MSTSAYREPGEVTGSCRDLGHEHVEGAKLTCGCRRCVNCGLRYGCWGLGGMFLHSTTFDTTAEPVLNGPPLRRHADAPRVRTEPPARGEPYMPLKKSWRQKINCALGKHEWVATGPYARSYDDPFEPQVCACGAEREAPWGWV